VKSENILTLLSWLATSTVLSLALFSTPFMGKIVSGEVNESLVSTISTIVTFSVVLGMPWFRLVFSKLHDGKVERKFAFSILSFSIALCFYPIISEAPEEGIGYNMVLCILIILVVYPITKIFGASFKLTHDSGG